MILFSYLVRPTRRDCYLTVYDNGRAECVGTMRQISGQLKWLCSALVLLHFCESFNQLIKAGHLDGRAGIYYVKTSSSRRMR